MKKAAVWLICFALVLGKSNVVQQPTCRTLLKKL